jgi:uncharacterized membrane protein
VSAAALVIGGIAPAVLLGISTVLMRLSIGAGASIPLYLAAVGLTTAAVGGGASLVTGESFGSGRAITFAVAMGLSWAAAIACISYGFGPLKLPVAIVAPLTNSNALVAVALGAIILGEWRSLDPTYVIAGTVLICAGATFVSLAR